MQNILKSTMSLLVIAAMFFVGCNDDKTDSSFITMNDSSANITISADGKTASVILQPTGSSEEIIIKASGSWSFVEESEGGDNDWCKIIREGDKIIISADEYPSIYDRNTISRIKLSNGISAVIKISQKGTEMADVKLDPQKIEFAESGGSQKVQVTANRNWVVTGHEGVDWITVAAEEGSFTVTTTANHTANDLNVVLKVTAGSTTNIATTDCEIILGKQTPAYINTKTDIVPISKNGGKIRFTVLCNRTWRVSTSDTWYTATTEGDEVILDVTSTSQTTLRTGTFKIQTTSGGDLIEKTITVNQYVNPMIFEYTAAANDATAVLPTIGNINLYIEWGDGTTESRSGVLYSQEIVHKYAAAGIYGVAVYGKASEMSYSAASVVGEVASFTALRQWGDLGLTNLVRAFSGSAITKVPAGYKDVMKNATNITHMFANSKLSEIPADFFEGCSNITLGNGIFSTTKLASIPSGLLDGLTNLNSAIAMFAYTPITEIPSDLFKTQSSLSGVNTIFKGCSSLKTIPDNIFTSATKLTNVLGAFSECSSLESIPAGLFSANTEITNMSMAFSECSSLESIPAGLFSANTEITNMSMAFEKCTALKSIPASLFDNCKKVINFNYTFSECTSLTGESPYTTIASVNYHLYERIVDQGFVVPTMRARCFQKCDGLTDYATIPDSWK